MDFRTVENLNQVESICYFRKYFTNAMADAFPGAKLCAGLATGMFLKCVGWERQNVYCLQGMPGLPRRRRRRRALFLLRSHSLSDRASSQAVCPYLRPARSCWPTRSPGKAKLPSSLRQGIWDPVAGGALLLCWEELCSSKTRHRKLSYVEA